MPGPTSADGSPSWTIHDPARHRFLRIGWLEFEILSRWGIGDGAGIAQSIAEETTIRAEEADVTAFLRFAAAAGLLSIAGPRGTQRLMEELRARKSSAGSWLLKHYLFLRLRLINPDRLLTAAVPVTRYVFTRGFLLTMLTLALVSVHLVSGQWDLYWHNFLDLFSVEGVILVALAMGGAKIVHEIGHGVTAKHFGCRVPAMGIALMVLWPVLWTDTTEAWRLTDRRKRMAIDAAGVGAELILAVLATLLWAVLADGPLRTAVFLLSSSTWIVTILVNVNPLMRFDGYYLLSDFLDVPNLQDRGFAYARWWLRETLFGWGVPPPEVFPPRLRTVVLTYALAAMTYRFFLFVGIAVLVYTIAFKALGVFLMAVELWWFVIRPIVAELRVWVGRAGSTRLNGRVIVTLSVFALMIAGLVVPWRGHIDAVALLRSTQETTLFTDEPGRLVAGLPNGAAVKDGEIVFRLESPAVDTRIDAVRAKIQTLRVKIEGQAFDAASTDDLEVSWQELQKSIAEEAALLAQRAALVVRAPFAGTVRDVPVSLHQGSWLSRRERLGMLVAPDTAMVEAYVAEADIDRLHNGAHATFYPANADAPIRLILDSVAPASARIIEAPEITSVHGGTLGVRKDTAGRLVPSDAVYRAILKPAAPLGVLPRRMPGHVVIDGDEESILAGIYRRTIATLIREMDL